MRLIGLILCFCVLNCLSARVNRDELDPCSEYLNPCKNGGLCENKNGNYSCNCPIYLSGEKCDEDAPLKECVNFLGNGYMELNRSAYLDNNLNESWVGVLFSFSTTEPNGLLLWLGQKNYYDGNDFMALAIVDGLLELTVRLKGYDGVITTPDRVDDGKFHEVHIKLFTAFFALGVDEFFDVFIFVGQDDQSYLPGNIFIGGAPNLPTFTGNRYTKPFNGAIKSVEKLKKIINGYKNQIYPPHAFNSAHSIVSGYNAIPCK